MTTTTPTLTCHLQSTSLICSLCRLTILSTRLQLTTSSLLTSSCTTTVDRYTERIRAFTVAIRVNSLHSFCYSFHIHIPSMLNALSAITRSLQCGEVLAPMRSSSCIDYIVCNLFAGYVNVSFSDGSSYQYNVRKRDILKLLTDNTVSYGFWVNNYCNLDNPVFSYA
jgi:hypothetical protein